MTYPNLYITLFHAPADSLFSALASWDHYRVHRMLCGGFGDAEELKAARVLFRFDFDGHNGFLYCQSKSEPERRRLEFKLGELLPDDKQFDMVKVYGPNRLKLPEITDGNRLRYRLLARPTIRIGDKADEEYGRRVSLDFEDEQRDWFEDKGDFHGFQVDSCRISDRYWHDSKGGEFNRGMPKLLKGIQFDGELTVTDRDLFFKALADGIGTQKAFGFGLLSVVPV